MQINIRPLAAADLPEADRIFRLAFGTFIGLPDPMTFAAGADLVASRWRAGGHVATFGAFDGERLVGSNIATRWGSFGFFGPLTVLPDYWDKGIAQLLLEPTMAQFAAWGVDAAGLFTFPHSPKHLGLYQKYDFWPQRLTPIMAKPPARCATGTAPWEGSREELLAATRAITGDLLPGLDLGGEIGAVIDQGLGEVVTVCGDHGLEGFAICHIGTGSEAGTGAALIKFAAVKQGDPTVLNRLLTACEAVAVRQGAEVLCAGVNTACQSAYQTLLSCGFRMQMTGVAMQRSNAPGYLHPDALVLGDWR